METLMGLMIGIGLSAATGFRVFVPFLGMSIAAMSGHLTLSSGFGWIGTWPAFIAFATATALEIGAYYVPWLDHLLDTITTPAAIVSGTIMTASMVGDISPLLKWSLAIIAGGGTAAIVQAGTAIARGTSALMTGGVGNFTVATAEAFGATLFTVIALMLPVLAVFAAGIFFFVVAKRILRSMREESTLVTK
jgi:hypothetical protein